MHDRLRLLCSYIQMRSCVSRAAADNATRQMMEIRALPIETVTNLSTANKEEAGFCASVQILAAERLSLSMNE